MGTGSVKDGTGWYLMVLGQYKAVLVGFCWYRLLLEDLQIFVGRFVDICWKICRFLLALLYCWKICRYLLVLFIVGRFVDICLDLKLTYFWGYPEFQSMEYW